MIASSLRLDGKTDDRPALDLRCRQVLFALLVPVGFANGISEKLVAALQSDGLLVAILNTFDISVILWGACVAGTVMLLRGPFSATRRLDVAVASGVALAFLLPVPSLSWLALSGMAAYLYLSSPGADRCRRAAAIVFALTIPPFWAHLLFTALADVILHFDATLVGWLVGTTPNGNIVPFAGGSGSMFIGPSCSSISNVSLAILSSVVLVNLYGKRFTPEIVGWTVAACLAVIAINVLRIGAIGVHPDYFDLLHGPVGGTVAGWLTLAAIFCIGVYGIGRDARLDI